MDTDKIAAAIRAARIKSGLTQKQVAESLDKSQTSVAAWETGRAQPDAKTVVLLAEMFNTSSDYLLGLSPSYSKEYEDILKEIFAPNQPDSDPALTGKVSELFQKLASFLHKVNLWDVKLTPMAANSIDVVLQAVDSIFDAYFLYKYVYLIRPHGMELVNKIQSLPDDKRKIIFDSVDSLEDMFDGIAAFEAEFGTLPESSFSAESLKAIENVRNSLASITLQLQCQLDSNNDQ